MNRKTKGILLVSILAISMTLSGCGSSAPKSTETEPATETVTEAQMTEQVSTEEQESIKESVMDAAPETMAEAGGGATAPADESQEESEEAAEPDVSEDGVITLTDFSSGILIDEEDGDYCEIVSMGMVEDGYLIEYKGRASGNRGSSFADIVNPVVNGISYIPILWPDADSSKYEKTNESNFLIIHKQWLDKLGIEEVQSLCFKLELGRMSLSSSSYDLTCEQEFTIYPKEEYTSPYEPDLPDTAKVLYETDDFQLILVNAAVTEDDTYYEQDLECFCLKKTEIPVVSVNLYAIEFADDVTIDLQSRVPNSAYGRTVSMQISRGANAAYMIYTWKSAKEYVDLSTAQIRLSYQCGNNMDTMYLTDKVGIDLSAYLK